MKPSARLQAFLNAGLLGELLEARGFRRRALVYSRRRGDTIQVIQFQSSRTSDERVVDFTINIGVMLHPVARIYEGEEVGDKVDEADCFPRFRIGLLLASFQQREALDRWWKVTDVVEHAAEAREVRQILDERVVPLLDRLTNVQEVASFIANEAPPSYPDTATQIMWAILRWLAGDAAHADKLLGELESNTRIGDEWQGRVRAVRARLAGVSS